MSEARTTATQRSIRRHLAAGVSLTLLLGGAVGGWAATTPLDGAVVAHGSLVVDSAVKQAQHPIGGVVAAIAVREGDRVEAGQLLIRLDATQARTALQIVTKRLDETLARKARGEAEMASSPDLATPPELAARLQNPDVKAALDGEKRLLAMQIAARDGKKTQLSGRIDELRETISGLTDQIASKDQQIALVDEELTGLMPLLEKKLVTLSRVTALKRERAATLGERGELTMALAEAKSNITGTELQIRQTDHDAREAASREVQEAQVQIVEFVERKMAAEDELRRVEIRSPQAGIIHKLIVHTVGGVVRPGETLMDIVPLQERLTVDVKMQPRNVNDVHAGQTARLRFSGLNQKVTPEVDGIVTMISADVTEDPRSGQSYYTARISVADDQFARMEGLRPLPGMPVEAFIKTGERTALAYFVQPLSDQIARAFREK